MFVGPAWATEGESQGKPRRDAVASIHASVPSGRPRATHCRTVFNSSGARPPLTRVVQFRERPIGHGLSSDGAAWIRAWFESLGSPLKAVILCWWHLRKRCYEQMSSAGGSKDHRRAFEKELLGKQLGQAFL